MIKLSTSIHPNIQEFLTIETKRELAQVLGIEYKILIYNLYKIPDAKKYLEFEIQKRNGGKRKICAPNSGIKYIQRILSQILLQIYPVKSCVHGFVREKGITSNSSKHINKKFLINIDLENFFPSINFGRVRGIFKSHPFNFNNIISTVLAQICCFNGTLPQGAPTSPIMSNYVCRKLDNRLMRFAKENRLTYSRYADDITFSTNVYPLPKKFGIIKDYKITLSKEITDIIERNDFKLNNSKIRYATKFNRQEVTGLVVNKFSNINRKYLHNVRAMLNAWEKYGLEKAATEHFTKYNHYKRTPDDEKITFEKILVGKIGFIGMVRGRDNSIYQKLVLRIKKLYPDVKLSVILKDENTDDKPIIFGEGKTDWKHLKAALINLQDLGFYKDLEITFKDYPNNLQINNDGLLDICKGASKASLHKNKIICVFDRDVSSVVTQVTGKNNTFKNWGNNVFSFALPIPTHRQFEEICIEHYYEDDEIKTSDNNGRRLFLSNEFDMKSGRHISDDYNYTDTNRLKKIYPFIIENKVYNNKSENVALPKDDFANNILNKKKPFDNFSFEKFKKIFDIIEKIIKTA